MLLLGTGTVGPEGTYCLSVGFSAGDDGAGSRNRFGGIFHIIGCVVIPAFITHDPSLTHSYLIRFISSLNHGGDAPAWAAFDSVFRRTKGYGIDDDAGGESYLADSRLQRRTGIELAKSAAWTKQCQASIRDSGQRNPFDAEGSQEWFTRRRSGR